MGEDIKIHKYFFLQMDESTAFVKYSAKIDISKDILFCRQLQTNTTGKCLFDIFMDFAIILRAPKL